MANLDRRVNDFDIIRSSLIFVKRRLSKLIDIYFQISNQYLIQFPIGFSRL